jgi:hypothetical protein
MTPAELRAWLEACAPGDEISIQPGHLHIQTTLTANQTSNTSAEHFIPIAVDTGPANPGPGVALRITNSSMAFRHGAYLPDVVNQCSRVNASQHGIVISGRFTGCRFIKAVDAAFEQHVGHVYADSSTPHNLPVAQAQAFKAAVGAIGHHSDGFLTRDRVQPPATAGYVFGTLVLGVWHWHWLTVSSVMIGDASVVECTEITGHRHWTPL